MWQPTPELLEDVIAYASLEMPKEACGVIIDGCFRPVINEAVDRNTFSMERESYLAALRSGSLEAIVHSHVYLPPIASQADRAMCEMTKVPWLIISVPTGLWTVVEPCGFVAPLIGRTWGHGSLDCWGLVRDGVKAFAGITLPDYGRRMEWWHRGDNTIMENIEDAGFVLLPQDTTPRHCDLIIVQVRSPVPNHMGLFIEPECLMLHHLANRVSVREPYGGFWKTATVHIGRHRNFIDYPAPPHDPLDRSVWTGEVVGQEPS